MGTRPPILEQDRKLILERTEALWRDARGSRFFITGGTGFLGGWLVEALTAAHDSFGLGLALTVLTRNPEAFATRLPHLARHPTVRLLEGDVRDFEFPSGRYQHFVHAAFDSSRDPGPEKTRSTIVNGTARSLAFAQHCRPASFLFVSSGAVYGPQPFEMKCLAEESAGQPIEARLRSAYGEAKWEAERMVIEAAGSVGMEVKIARGFAFVGPRLPLDAHFAIGNFIRDALAGGRIGVRGDGSAVRSYLYAADLVIWLLTILYRGKASRAYNVGSEEEITIGQLAHRVAATLNPGAVVDVASPLSAGPAERYVPCTRRAREELGLVQTVGLEESLRRTAQWLRTA